MPRCRICGEWFVGGSPKHDKNVCMWCYVKLEAEKRIEKAKQKNKNATMKT